MVAFTQEMQEKLLKEREELLRKLNAEEDNFRQEALAASGRDSSDLASDDAAYRKMEALGALKRISEGKYGICLQCGKKIPEGRLRAIPSAVLCIDCKTENEKLGV